MTNSPAPPPAPSTTSLVARTPEDLLAVVPIVLGFVPEESVVMLTFGAERTFHARVNLPDLEPEIPEMVSALLGPALHHGVRRVVFIVYSDDPAFSEEVLWSLVTAFETEAVEVAEVLRADGSHWYPLLRAHPDRPDPGTPYDVSCHHFTARSVLEGRVTHASRDDLAASLRPDAAAVRAVSAVLGSTSGGRRQVAAETAWARGLVAARVLDGGVLDDREVARLLRALVDIAVRDGVWALMGLDNARAHVHFWTDVVRRAPDSLLPAPASLLGFAAWLAGQGALAWCALDRCAEVEPDHSLAGLVAGALIQAVPPSTWPGPDLLDDPA